MIVPSSLEEVSFWGMYGGISIVTLFSLYYLFVCKYFPHMNSPDTHHVVVLLFTVFSLRKDVMDIRPSDCLTCMFIHNTYSPPYSSFLICTDILNPVWYSVDVSSTLLTVSYR
jgi:hypothetical protein